MPRALEEGEPVLTQNQDGEEAEPGTAPVPLVPPPEVSRSQGLSGPLGKALRLPPALAVSRGPGKLQPLRRKTVGRGRGEWLLVCLLLPWREGVLLPSVAQNSWQSWVSMVC